MSAANVNCHIGPGGVNERGIYDLLFVNISSVRKNYNQFCNYIYNANITPKIIALSETWLNTYEKDIYNIDGYYSIMSNIKINRADGVTFYIRNDVSVQQINIDIVYESFNYVHFVDQKNELLI
jgi:exonuclease III